MTGERYQSEWHFKVWAYSASHNRLLLRSAMEGRAPSRIDIYFPGVERMLLRPSYPGLNAAVASPEEVALYREKYGEIGGHHTLFTLEPDLGSFVVAGVMQWYEDQGGYDDLSVFGRFD